MSVDGEDDRKASQLYMVRLPALPFMPVRLAQVVGKQAGKQASKQMNERIGKMRSLAITVHYPFEIVLGHAYYHPRTQ